MNAVEKLIYLQNGNGPVMLSDYEIMLTTINMSEARNNLGDYLYTIMSNKFNYYKNNRNLSISYKSFDEVLKLKISILDDFAEIAPISSFDGIDSKFFYKNLVDISAEEFIENFFSEISDDIIAEFKNKDENDIQIFLTYIMFLLVSTLNINNIDISSNKILDICSKIFNKYFFEQMSKSNENDIHIFNAINGIKSNSTISNTMLSNCQIWYSGASFAIYTAFLTTKFSIYKDINSNNLSEEENFFYKILNLRNDLESQYRITHLYKDDDNTIEYICKNCNEVIDYLDKYCKHCGSKLDWDNKKDNEEVEEINEDLKKCEYCNKSFDKVFTICPYCKRKQREYYNDPLYAIAIIFVIIMIISVLWFYNI